MKICDKVQEILKTNNTTEFINLVKFLKNQNCKTETEIRGMFANCGMNPEIFDSFIRLSHSEKK